MILLKCLECGKEYEVMNCRQWIGGSGSKSYGKKKRKYCSTECQYKAQRREWNSKKERDARSKRAKGSKNSNWRGGKCNKRTLLRATREYKDFVQNTMKRDKYTCSECSQIGGKLCVHHKKQVAIYPELIMEQSNVITMCKACHTTTDSYLVVPRRGN